MPPRQSARVRNLRAVRPFRARRTPAPEADGSPPPKPDWLSPQQSATWDFYAAELRAAGLLRPLAAGPLLDLVIAECLKVNAAALLNAEGLTVEGKRGGETVRHPSVMTWRAASDVARKAARDLGIIAPAASPPVAPDPGYKDPARLLDWPG